MANDIDPVRRYLDLKQRKTSLEKDLAAVAAFFRPLVEAFTQQPIRLMLSNTPSDWGAPPEVALSRGVASIDYQRWPAKEDVADKLKEYHALDLQLLSAIHELSSADRESLGI